jgi:hypothetical protein
MKSKFVEGIYQCYCSGWNITALRQPSCTSQTDCMSKIMDNISPSQIRVLLHALCGT